MWAAIAHNLEHPIGDKGVLAITARANRPLRVSVQLRADSTDADLRWRHSVYLDPTPRTVQIPVSEMQPVTRSLPAGRLAAARGVLLVIDRTEHRARHLGHHLAGRCPGQVRTVRSR